MVAFHAQQAVEKVLKAVLEEKNIEILKVHNLVKIYHTIKPLISINIDEDMLITLSGLYTDSRYPGDFGVLPDGKPGTDEAEEFYNFAKKLLKDIKKILK
ncbi:MAG: HEPN domain-containing protein [Oligoflexia bacterium]|nr:HEPN domain-containing protein [Oligoflexia bacterium]